MGKTKHMSKGPGVGKTQDIDEIGKGPAGRQQWARRRTQRWDQRGRGRQGSAPSAGNNGEGPAGQICFRRMQWDAGTAHTG